MGLFKRINDIIKSNTNAALDKMENPAAMLEQYIRNAEGALGQVKSQVADAMVTSKRCNQKVSKYQSQIEELTAYASSALEAGNEEDVEKFIAEKLRVEASLEEAEKAASVATENVKKMRAMHDDLVEKINDYKSRRDIILSKIAVAEVAEKTAASPMASGNYLSDLERMDEKVNHMLDKAFAMSELNTPKDALSDTKKKYDLTRNNNALQEAVLAFKKEHGFVPAVD